MELRSSRMTAGTRIAIVMALTTACLAMILGPGRAAAADWSDPFPVSTDQIVNSPRMEFLPDGSSTLVWNRPYSTVLVADRDPGDEFEISDTILGRPGDRFGAVDLTSNEAGTVALLTSSWSRNDVILQVRTRPADGEFGEPVTVARSDRLGSSQVGLDPDGTLVVTWTEPDPSGTTADVYSWVREPGDDFSTTTRLGLSEYIFNLAIADTGPDGTTTVLWPSLSISGGDLTIHSRTRPPGGNFGPLETVEPGGSLSVYPEVVVNGDGSSSLYWLNNGFQYLDRPPGGPWGAPQSVAGGTGMESGFDVAVGAYGTTLAVWSKGERIFAARRAPGDPFSTAQQISDAGATTPLVTIGPDGTSTVIWRGPRNLGDSTRYLIQGAYGDGADVFAEPVDIAETTVRTDPVQVDSGQGGTTAFWTTGRAVSSEIAWFDRTPTGFTEMATLSGSPGTASNPKVTSTFGVATTLWELDGPGTRSVEQQMTFATNPTHVSDGTSLSAASSDPDVDSRVARWETLAAVWVHRQGSRTLVQGAFGGRDTLSNPVTLAEPQYDETDPGPAVAIGAQGSATAAWRSKRLGRFPGSPYPVVETLDFNASGGDQNPLVVSSQGETVDEIDVASGRTNATSAIVWTGGDGNAIRAAVRRPGERFSEPVTVSRTTSGAHPVVRVASDGQVIVAWLDTSTGRVRYAVSKVSNRFSDPATPPNGASQQPPGLSIDANGGFRLIWTRPDGKVMTGAGSGIKVRSAVLSGNGDPDSAPVIDANELGNAALAWRTADGEIEATRTTESGAIEPTVTASAGPIVPGSLDVTADEGGLDAQIVWVDPSGVVFGSVSPQMTLDCASVRKVNFKGTGRKSGRYVVRLRAGGAGHLRVTPGGPFKASIAQTKGNTVTSLPLRLRAAAARKLKRKGSLKATVRVAFRPAGSCLPTTRNFKLKLKRP